MSERVKLCRNSSKYSRMAPCCLKVERPVDSVGQQNHAEAKVPQTGIHPKGPDTSSSKSLLQQLWAQTVSYKDKSCAQPVYAIRRLQQNLLALPATQALNLLTQVDTLEKTPVPKSRPIHWTEHYPGEL